MGESGDRQNRILIEIGTNELEIITFSLRWRPSSTGRVESALYGINAAKVREITCLPATVTPIANSPECVKGVFLLRNKTIPLVDLCTWFRYIPEDSPESMQKWTVIVAEMNGKMFGFINHGVDKVYRVSWEDIQPPHELLAGLRAITGTVLLDSRLIQMVDFENIIATIDPSMLLQAGSVSVPAAVLAVQGSKAVFVADDSRVIRDLLVRTLSAGGFRVVAFNDGMACWEALEKLRRDGLLEQRVLAVISDIEMPRMDGHNFCLRIRENQAYARIPVILFSSLINDAMRRKGAKVGADDQITKPEIDKLVERVCQLVEEKWVSNPGGAVWGAQDGSAGR